MGKLSYKHNLKVNKQKYFQIYRLKSPISNLFLLFLRLMLTLTTHTLEKLEILLRTAGYRVRYEKGNFKTGACMLLNSQVVVVNKFSNLESKIYAITELIRELELDYNLLDEKQVTFLQLIKQTKLQL